MTLLNVPFSISVFNNDSPAPLSKTLSLDGIGRLVKSSAASLANGIVERRAFKSLASFLEMMCSLPTNEAVACGVSPYPCARVVTRDRLKDAPKGEIPVIARTRSHFAWDDGPGLLLLDYDPPQDSGPLSPDDLVAALRLAVPELVHVTIGHKPSASSCIVRDDGKELRGIEGQHLFIVVKHAADIPRIGRLISDRLWLAGFGYLRLAADGKVLERTLFDSSVWQPERLVFGRAYCGAGLRQNSFNGRIFPGSADSLLEAEFCLDGNALPELSLAERSRLETIKATAQTRIQSKADEKRAVWLDHRAKEAAGPEASAEVVASVRASIEAAHALQILPEEFVLRCHDGRTVAVSELMEHPAIWNGVRFADPIEPDYGNDPRIAVACLTGTGRPHIHSHAHGGIKYWLVSPEPESIGFTNLDASAALLRRAFEVIPAADFVEGPPRDWFIKNLLGTSALSMVYGAPGSGKTFFVLYMIWCIARGDPWLGRRTKPGRVVYVATEGVAGLRTRLRAFSDYAGVPLTDLPIGIVQDTPDLRQNDHIQLISEIERFGGADVVVIDTLAQATAGADENSGQDMSVAIDRCNKIIANTGATVILIHHSGKDPSRGARGWSGMRGAMDTEIFVERTELGSRAMVTKQKDGPTGDGFKFSLISVNLGVDEDGESITSCAVKLEEEVSTGRPPSVTGKWQRSAMKTFECLAEWGEVELTSLIREAAGKHSENRAKDSVARAVNGLIERGLLSLSGTGIVTSPHAHNPPQRGTLRGQDGPPTPHLSLGGVVGVAHTM